MTAEFSRRQMLALSAADGQRTDRVRPGVLRPECSGKSLVMGVDLR
jgi:hypothetical protein